MIMGLRNIDCIVLGKKEIKYKMSQPFDQRKHKEAHKLRLLKGKMKLILIHILIIYIYYSLKL